MFGSTVPSEWRRAELPGNRVDFSFSEDQELLRNSLRTFLTDRYSFEERRATAQSDRGWRPEIWMALARDLDVLGTALPQRLGGLGADPVMTLVMMEEFGRALFIEPYLETVVICGGLLARAGSDRADNVLRQIAQGTQTLAFASSDPNSRYELIPTTTRARWDGDAWVLDGAKSVVVAAPWATQLLVTASTAGGPAGPAGVSLFLVETATPGVRATHYPTVDGRRAADIVFENVRLPADALLGPAGRALASIEQSADEAIAALSAEALGVLSRLLHDTLDYTKQRRQFGQPLAGFQVLQHRMVDMYMEVEMARSATLLVTLKLTAGPHERALAASAAKVTVSKACRFVGQNAIQLHGGMGLTDDLPVSHYFRRATALEAEFGTVDFHLARYAALTRPAAEQRGIS